MFMAKLQMALSHSDISNVIFGSFLGKFRFLVGSDFDWFSYLRRSVEKRSHGGAC